eukprot:scaffold2659_cov376-Prasinococcus_capsulatus_cf.AAC.3
MFMPRLPPGAGAAGIGKLADMDENISFELGAADAGTPPKLPNWSCGGCMGWGGPKDDGAYEGEGFVCASAGIPAGSTDDPWTAVDAVTGGGPKGDKPSKPPGPPKLLLLVVLVLLLVGNAEAKEGAKEAKTSGSGAGDGAGVGAAGVGCP